MNRFFIHPDEPFRQMLASEYLLPVAGWLLGEETEPHLLPKVAGSCWECSLAIEFLCYLRDSELADPALRARIDRKVAETSRWLMSQAIDMQDGRRSWEGTHWDTAVCVRALVVARGSGAESFTPVDLAQLDTTIEDASRWLVDRVESWNTENRHVITPADLAQTLLTLTLIAKVDKSVLRRIASGRSARPLQPLEDAARLLVASAEPVATVPGTTNESEMFFWADVLNSSEVIDALSEFTEFVSRLKKPERTLDSEFLSLIDQRVFGCVRYLELNQYEGEWSGVGGTCGTLYGYLRVVSRYERMNHHDLVVFKAVRWMCDERQSLADGSFLHTTFITVFYALALWETYRSWPLAHTSTVNVYDVSIWLEPNLISNERSRRLELELEAETATATIRELRTSIFDGRLFAVSLATSLLLIVSTFLLSVATGFLVVDVELTVPDPGGFWSLIGVAAAVIPIAVGTLRAGMSRRVKR